MSDGKHRRACSGCGKKIRARGELCLDCGLKTIAVAPVVTREKIDEGLAAARAGAERQQHLSELRLLTKVENHRRAVLDHVQKLVPLVSAPRLARSPFSNRERPIHSWGLVISDWQLGQRDTLASTGGLFEQNTDVVKWQVTELWKTVGRLHDIYRSSIDVEELVIFSLGDLLENDQMRPSQAGHIDSLVTQQAVAVFDLESWLVQQALARFPKVRLLHVGGNHERTSQKAGNAGLGELGFLDTYSWLIGEMLKRQHDEAIRSGRLKIVNHETFFGMAKVAGLRCVYEHGASFRSATGSYGGVSYYSIAKAAAGYQSMLDGADVVLMGHHHVGMLLPMGQRGWQVMNGALTPSSAYGQTNFKSVRRPMQWLLNFNQKHGLVGNWPIYLDTPSMARPGEAWERLDG